MGEGFSRNLIPQPNSWKAMALWWGSNGPKTEINTHMPLPFVQYEGGEFVASQALTDYNVRQADGTRKSDNSNILSFYDVELGKYKNTLKEKLQFFGTNANFLGDYTDYVYSSQVGQSKKSPKGVVCEEITQWIIADIYVNTLKGMPQTKALIWAFLQPRGFDGETPLSAKDLKGDQADEAQKKESRSAVLSNEDFPRSGWSEYEINFVEKTVVRSRFDKGVRRKEAVNAEDFNFFLIEQDGDFLGYRIKLKIRVTNDITPDDQARRDARWKKMKEAHQATNPKAPLKEEDVLGALGNIEAGCWLKVWIRNANIQWSLEPCDDESNKCRSHMDYLDCTEGTLAQGERPVTVKNRFPFKNHGFIRGRLASGKTVKIRPPTAETIEPLYAALVTKEAVSGLKDLVNYLKQPAKKQEDVGLFRWLTSTAVTLFPVYVIFAGLKKWMKSYADSVRKMPQKPGETAELFKKRKSDAICKRAERIIWVITALGVQNRLAAFAADGFEHFTLKGLDETAKAKPSQVSFYSMLISMVIDFAVRETPEVYEKAIRTQLEAREKALREFLGMEPAPEAKKSLWKKAAEYAKEAKLDASDSNVLSLTLPLLNKEGSEKFPKPFGIPLLTPAGIPIAFFSFTFSYKAALEFLLQLELDEDKIAFGAGISMPPSTNIHVGMDLCAPWSVMSDPAYVAANEKYRVTDLNAAATREKTEETLKNGNLKDNRDVDFGQMNLLKVLQNNLDVDASVAVGLRAEGYVGFRSAMSQKDNLRKIEFMGMKGHPIGVSLNGDMVCGLKLLCFSWAYTILDLKLMDLSQESVSFPLNGKFFGNQFSKAGKREIVFGQKVDEFLHLEPEKPVAGQAATPAATQSNPPAMGAQGAPKKMFVYWGRSLKVFLGYAADMEEAPETKLRAYPHEGQESTGPSATAAWAAECISTDMTRDESSTVTAQKMSGTLEFSVKDLGQLAKTQKSTKFLIEQSAKHLIVPLVVEAESMRKKHLFPNTVRVELFQPYLQALELQTIKAKNGLLVVRARLKISHFFGEGVWVRFTRQIDYLPDYVVKNNGEEWAFFEFTDSKVNNMMNSLVLDIPGRFLDASRGVKLFMEVSLMPDEAGILNAPLCQQKIFIF